MEEMFDPSDAAQEDYFGNSKVSPTAKIDPMTFGGDDVDMELVKKRQESDIERENAMRTKAAEELEKKKERIKKGEQELQEALKARQAKIDEIKKKHREEQEKKIEERKSPKDPNPWAKVVAHIDLNGVSSKDISRMKQCIMSKLNNDK